MSNNTNNKINKMCDKAISIINKYSQSNFISDDKCNTLADKIQELKNKQERSLATEINEQHEKNLKQYVESGKSNSDYSQEFVDLQSECIFILNEIEEALYLKEKLNL